ncbi:fibrous sheath-interacting protein 1-like protein [Aphelenchoides avenae]|nr:fibrous sheath-interacting protein 1-like protein [Aphelenchus avenae]
MSVPTGSSPRLLFPENTDSGSDNQSTVTIASNSVNREALPGAPFPAHNAGEDDQESLPEGQNSATDHADTPTAQQPTERVQARDTPSEIAPLRDLTLRSEDNDTDPESYTEAPQSPIPQRTEGSATVDGRPSASNPRLSRRYNPEISRPQPLYYGNSSLFGLFAQSDGLLSNASTMAWQNTHSGDARHHRTSLYVAPTSRTTNVRTTAQSFDQGSPVYQASLPAAQGAPAYRSARNTVRNAGDGYRSRQTSPSRSPPPTRTIDSATRTAYREQMQHDLRSASPPAGRGRSRVTFASEDSAFARPTATARTSQPPSSHVSVQQRSLFPPPDNGADFGPENASKFYQNAVYTRSSNPTSQPLVLKELPIDKFGGDIRAYPAFRNHFLELVENRKDFEPRHKFQYLLQCLTDEPLLEARRYMITNSNYFKVLDRLENKYGNRGRLLLTLNQCYYDLNAPGPAASDVRRFYDEASHLVDEMQQIGEDNNTATRSGGKPSHRNCIPRFAKRSTKRSEETRPKHRSASCWIALLPNC